MNDQQFESLMNYVMGTDPDPSDFVVTSGDDAIVQALLDEEAAKRGFKSWYVAYHDFDANYPKSLSVNQIVKTHRAVIFHPDYPLNNGDPQGDRCTCGGIRYWHASSPYGCDDCECTEFTNDIITPKNKVAM